MKLDFSSLPQYFGIAFDATTGKTYQDAGDGETYIDTGFTFEDARWSGPGVDYKHTIGTLNPLSFATHETALKVLDAVSRALPAGVYVALNETSNIVGPFTRTIERRLDVTNGDVTDTFNCGLIANSIIRQGEKTAMRRFLAECRAAGLIG